MKRWYRKLFDMMSEKCLQECFLATQPTGIICTFWWNFSTVLTINNNLFSQSLCSFNRDTSLVFFLPLTTSALCGTARSNKLTQTSFASKTTQSPKVDLRLAKNILFLSFSCEAV